MLKHVSLTLLLGISLMQGGSSPATQVWKASEIQDKGRALSQKVDANKVASETITTVGNRTFMVSHREGSGQAELHEKQADIMFISSGRVTMVYGGSVVDGKTTAPGEVRGSAIQGGTEVQLGPGDVLHIPAKTPHQMKLAAEAQVTYFVVKVVE